MSSMHVAEIIECLKDLDIPIDKIAGDSICIKGTDIRINRYLDNFPENPWQIVLLRKDINSMVWTNIEVHTLFDVQDWFINEFEKHK